MSFRQRPDYRNWQEQVKERDGHTCKRCGFTSNLHTHHIKPVHTYPELTFDIDNGITLCGNCHSLITGKEDEIDIEEFIGESLSDDVDVDLDNFVFGSPGVLAMIESDDLSERKDAKELALKLSDLFDVMMIDFSVGLTLKRKEKVWSKHARRRKTACSNSNHKRMTTSNLRC